MKDSQYWINRARQRMKSYHKGADETIFLITNAYDKAILDIEEDIRKIYDKFKFDSGLSDIEIRKILNARVDIKVLEGLKEQILTIEDPDIRKEVMTKLNAPAYKARITRLEALKLSIYAKVKKVADIELKQSRSLYINTIKKSYYQSIFNIQKGIDIGFDVASMPIHIIEKILEAPWSGKNFSERIWKNTDIAADKVTDIMLSGFMSGRTIDQMSRELRDFADVSKYVASRLIRTELTYISNQGEIEGYKECNIEEYMYLATLDLRTSEICRELDNKIFKVSESEPGKNFPPMHVFCRSTTRAWFGKDTLKGIERRARDPKTGKTYLIPADTNYEEWYQKYVIDKYGQDQAKVMKDKILNKSNDKVQYDKYKEILGKDIPNSFDKFQDMKYNNSEDYRLIKLDYSRRNRLINNPELKLPDVEKAVIAEDKFTKYLFAGKNEDGLIKGKLIANKLGYDINNYKEFEKDILTRAEFNPSKIKGENKQGIKYEQRIIFYNKHNTPVNLEVGWLNSPSGTHMTSIYINEVKKDES